MKTCGFKWVAPMMLPNTRKITLVTQECVRDHNHTGKCRSRDNVITDIKNN